MSVFAPRSLSPLSNDQLLRAAPSIFAETPWDGVSDRYSFVSTAQIVERLRAEGMVPVQARQSNTRLPGKKAFARHEVRFVDRSLLESGNQIVIGGTYPLVALTNSHDTGSAFSIDAGMFRLVCGNGMMVPNGIAQSVRVRHSGDMSDVIEGVFSVVEETQALPDLIREYSGITLSRDAQRAFATAALELRESSLPLTPEQVLTPRRMDDRGPDLWTVTNRIQENLVKGGLHSRTATGRRTSTRAIQDITADQKLNKALFVLAESLKSSLH